MFTVPSPPLPSDKAPPLIDYPPHPPDAVTQPAPSGDDAACVQPLPGHTVTPPPPPHIPPHGAMRRTASASGSWWPSCMPPFLPSRTNKRPVHVPVAAVGIGACPHIKMRMLCRPSLRARLQARTAHTQTLVLYTVCTTTFPSSQAQP